MRIKGVFCSIGVALLPAFTVGSAIPDLARTARVKQHRAGAEGNLVIGEENLRKIIISWNEIRGASYEVCHMCSLGEDGVHDPSVGTLIPAPDTCGGKPCSVFPGAFIGLNSFRVRASTGGEWGAWSDERRFEVGDEYGQISDVDSHAEL
mmetsp:Transcript_41453/g.49731  ORF Transcript_41453/g.49731 Transcript_41453/m.49731 type:complete len:150 (-) Transcript_41453:412-861(-)